MTSNLNPPLLTRNGVTRVITDYIINVITNPREPDVVAFQNGSFVIMGQFIPGIDGRYYPMVYNFDPSGNQLNTYTRAQGVGGNF